MDGSHDITRSDPRWDWADRAIIEGWHRLNERRCPRCGRPIEVHADDSIDDYKIGSYVCTAAMAMERWSFWWRTVSHNLPLAAKAQARAERQQRKDGRDPDMYRDWTTYTDAEGPPSY